MNPDQPAGAGGFPLFKTFESRGRRLQARFEAFNFNEPCSKRPNHATAAFGDRCADAGE